MKQISEGAGIGLLGGLLIGITDSDWIRLIIALALIAFTGKSLKETILKAEPSLRQSATGIAAFVAVLVGLYINGQKTFDQLPSQAVDKWVKAGFSPEEARAIYLKTWECENQKDSEPSPAVQAMIKSILDRMDTRGGADKEINDSIPPQFSPDSVSTDPEEQLPGVPAEG
ncbi:MAG: hypothetical protein AB9834_14870 [Lentimicrobium sp.]